jgi:sugar phosphate isomerase/epimerase
VSPFRLCTSTLHLSTSLRAALRRARTLGLDGVEIDARTGLGPDAAEGLSQTGRRQIRKWVEDEGLAVAAVAFPTRGGYADAERLEGRIAATKEALSPADGAADDPRWKLLVEVLTDVGQWGTHCGAVLAAEVGRAAPADLVRLLAALPEGGVGCHLITGAALVHGHDPLAAVATLGGRILHVHATDAVAGPFAGRGRAVVLGTGQVELPAVLAALDDHGYRGWVGIEPIDTVGTDAEITAAMRAIAAA